MQPEKDDKKPMTLRDLRRQQGLTALDLASLVGIDKATVSRVERGLISPWLSTAAGMAGALGITLDEFHRLIPKPETED